MAADSASRRSRLRSRIGGAEPSSRQYGAPVRCSLLQCHRSCSRVSQAPSVFEKYLQKCQHSCPLETTPESHTSHSGSEMDLLRARDSPSNCSHCNLPGSVSLVTIHRRSTRGRNPTLLLIHATQRLPEVSNRECVLGFRKRGGAIGATDWNDGNKFFAQSSSEGLPSEPTVALVMLDGFSILAFPGKPRPQDLAVGDSQSLNAARCPFVMRNLQQLGAHLFILEQMVPRTGNRAETTPHENRLMVAAAHHLPDKPRFDRENLRQHRIPRKVRQLAVGAEPIVQQSPYNIRAFALGRRHDYVNRIRKFNKFIEIDNNAPLVIGLMLAAHRAYRVGPREQAVGYIKSLEQLYRVSFGKALRLIDKLGRGCNKEPVYVGALVVP